MNGEKSYPYDVFISYRWVSPDQEWVREQLYPALTGAGLKVCLDVEDFALGQHVINEMTRAGKESRHVLCVISPAYLEENRMVEFEWLMAAQSDAAGRNSRLIPLILRPAPLPDAISGRIAADWTNPKHHAREWRRLLRDLGKPDSTTPPPKPLRPEDTPPILEEGGADAGVVEKVRIVSDLGVDGKGGKEGDQEAEQQDDKDEGGGGGGGEFPYRFLFIAAAAAVGLVVAVVAYKYYMSRPHTLEGFIYEASGSRLPVSGATVRVPNSNRQTVTDGQGKFVLEGVPAGRRLKALEFDYAGQPRGFELNVEQRYYVFPTPTPTPPPVLGYIEQHEWIPVASVQLCENEEEEEPFAEVRRYELADKKIKHPPGTKEFVLTLESLDPDEVFNTEIVRPPDARTSTIPENEKRRPGNRAERWVMRVPEQGGEL